MARYSKETWDLEIFEISIFDKIAVTIRALLREMMRFCDIRYGHIVEFFLGFIWVYNGFIIIFFQVWVTWLMILIPEWFMWSRTIHGISHILRYSKEVYSIYRSKTCLDAYDRWIFFQREFLNNPEWSFGMNYREHRQFVQPNVGMWKGRSSDQPPLYRYKSTSAYPHRVLLTGAPYTSLRKSQIFTLGDYHRTWNYW